MVAECHACGKVGPYQDPSCGRPKQHNASNGKYCGYFRVCPRIQEEIDIVVSSPTSRVPYKRGQGKEDTTEEVIFGNDIYMTSSDPTSSISIEEENSPEISMKKKHESKSIPTIPSSTIVKVGGATPTTSVTSATITPDTRSNSGHRMYQHQEDQVPISSTRSAHLLHISPIEQQAHIHDKRQNDCSSGSTSVEKHTSRKRKTLPPHERNRSKITPPIIADTIITGVDTNSTGTDDAGTDCTSPDTQLSKKNHFPPSIWSIFLDTSSTKHDQSKGQSSGGIMISDHEDLKEEPVLVPLMSRKRLRRKFGKSCVTAPVGPVSVSMSGVPSPLYCHRSGVDKNQALSLFDADDAI